MIRKSLLPPQEAAVEFLTKALNTWNGVLNASEVGTGKTLMTVEMIRRLGRRALVICPFQVVPGWIETAEEQGLRDRVDVINYEKIRRGTTPFAKQFRAQRNRRLQFQFQVPKDVVLIWDECHACKAYDSQNAAMLTCATEAGYSNILLSATPFRDPTELKAIGYALKLHQNFDYWGFAMAHGCGFGPRKNLVFDHDDQTARRQLMKIGEELYRTRAVRVKRTDLHGHFRNCVYDLTPIDFGAEQKRIAATLAEVAEELEKLAATKAGDGPSPEASTKLIRARQQVEILKTPTFISLIRQYLADGFSVFATRNFDAGVDLLIKMLTEPEDGSEPVRLCVIRGGQTARQRQEAISAFSKNEVRVCIANTAAGNVGINLQDLDGGFPRVALIEPNYDEKQLEQVLGRTDRLGAKSDTLQRLLVAAGTVEKKVLEKVLQKIATSALTHSPTAATLQLLGAPAEKQDAPSKPQIQPAPPNITTMDAVFIAPELAGQETVSVSSGAVSKPAASASKPGQVPQSAGASASEKQAPALPQTPDAAPQKRIPDDRPAHHEFGPSGFKHIVACPGFWQAPSTNEAAERGTRVHSAVETSDDSGLESDYEKMLADKLRVTESMLFRKYADKLGPSFTEVAEGLLDIDHAHNEYTFGTCDKVFISTDKKFALVIDYKTGRESVDPPAENWQAKHYTMGVMQRYKTVEEVHFWFILPARGEVSSGAFRRSQLKQIALESGDAIVKAKMVRRLRAAGQDVSAHLRIKMATCRFCDVPKTAHGCELWSRIGVDIANKYQPSFKVDPDKVHGSTVSDPAVAGFLFATGKILEKAIEGWNKRVRELIFEHGATVPYIRVMQKAGARKITNVGTAYQVASKFGVTHQEFIEAVGSISVSSWETVVGNHAPPKGKGKLVQQALSELAQAEGIKQNEDTFELRIDPEALNQFTFPAEAVKEN